MQNPKLLALKSSHIYPDPESSSFSGYLLLRGSKIEGIIPGDSPEVSTLPQRGYEIKNYENHYIFPGFIDLNVHFNSLFHEDWQDITNIGKMALQGGVTTLIDNPIMSSYPPNLTNITDFDENAAISQRIHALSGKLATDTGLLAYLGPHNVDKLASLAKSAEILGFRAYLSSPLQPHLPFFEAKDLQTLRKRLESCTNSKASLFLHCEQATNRDLFTCSPLRTVNPEARLDLNVDIKDAAKFGGGIHGGMEELADSSQKSSSSSSSESETEEEKDQVGVLHEKNERNGKKIGFDEISSGVLRKKADKNAKLQEEQSIARLEIVGYAFNEGEKEMLQKLDVSDSEMEFVNLSSESEKEDEKNSNEKTAESVEKKEELSHKEIKVENLKRNVATNKLILTKQGQKRGSFLKNPLIESLRGALTTLNSEENKEVSKEDEENDAKNSNNSEPLNIRSRFRSPSSLLQRRKLTGSPTQQSPNTIAPGTNLTDFKINIKKSNVEEDQQASKELKINQNYQLFLSNHSLSWETNGISCVLGAFGDFFLESSNQHTLIFTNLSSSSSAFQVRTKNKATNYKNRVFCETSTPFLYFHMDHIKPGQTKFKCSPCIRDKETRNLLIDGLKLPHLFSAVSSFHLQPPKAYKTIEKGNFKRAFNGVSTIGSNLAVLWTKLYATLKRNHKKSGANLQELEEALKKVVYLLASSPANLANLSKQKGTLRKGKDADLVIWDPFAVVEVKDKDIYLKDKQLYLFRGQKFYGKVVATYLRGNCVFNQGEFVTGMGQVLRKDQGI